MREPGESEPACPPAPDAARELADRRVRESEERYRVVVGHTSEVVFVVQNERFVFVNDAGLRALGLTEQEFLGLPITAVLPAGEHDRAMDRTHRLAAGDLATDITEFRVRVPSGELRLFRVRSVRVAWNGAPATLNFANDITESRAAEVALRESEERYRVLFEGINDAVFVNEIVGDNEPGRFLQVNDVACRRLGYSRDELLRLTPRDISTPEAFTSAADMRDHLAARRNDIIETVHLAKDGRRLSVESNIHHFQYMGRTAALSISRDISDRKRAEAERLEMERQILHVQKLESLGVLAGGIAHDFNNILVAVLGYADLARSELPPSSPARESVEGIETAAHRAADLCRQMLAYSGRGKFVIESIQLGELVTGMLHLAKASVSKRAVLNVDVDGVLPPIEGDVTQIRQVVMNLITNASEALGEQGGVVSVKSSVESCTRADLSQMAVAEDPKDGTYVCLEVADTGCGMDADTLSRIFDPFFTTKFTGRGLGLAAVLGIVRGHKGAIDIRSEPGRGTAFRVLFPATGPRPGERAVREPADGSALWRGHGLVLVVDDEEMVRRVARLMLERSGFDVVCAASGRDALVVFQEQRDRIALVLLDLTMQGLDGEATFRALRGIDPKVAVLMSSGFTEQEITARLAGQGVAGFVQKPYTQAALLDRVREALERRSRM